VISGGGHKPLRFGSPAGRRLTGREQGKPLADKEEVNIEELRRQLAPRCVVAAEILAEVGPTYGIGTVDRDGDGRRKYMRGMPPAGRHEECLARVQGEERPSRCETAQTLGVPIFMSFISEIFARSGALRLYIYGVWSSTLPDIFSENVGRFGCR
jgi:hypothetical protein